MAHYLDDKCLKCTKKAKFTCVQCKWGKYCSAECQKTHWKTHKVYCSTATKRKALTETFYPPVIASYATTTRILDVSHDEEAGPGIEVRFVNPMVGKGLFATKDFAKDDVIMVEAPILCCYMHETRTADPSCFCCLQSLSSTGLALKDEATAEGKKMQEEGTTEREKRGSTKGKEKQMKQTGVPCTFACGEAYCSEKCRQNAWIKYHRLLCVGVLKSRQGEEGPEKGKGGGDISDRLAALEELNSLFEEMSGWTEFLLVVQLCAALLCQMEQTKRPFSHLWVPFSQFLQASNLEMCTNLGMGVVQLGALQYLWKRGFSLMKAALECCLPEESSDPVDKKSRQDAVDTLFTYSSFVNLLGMTNLNSVYRVVVKDQVEGGEKKPIGYKGKCLYLVQSCINHSCEPNAAVEERGTNKNDFRIPIVAKQDISKGEEINISYFPPGWERRLELQKLKYYMIDCWCAKCLKEKLGEEAKDKPANK